MAAAQQHACHSPPRSPEGTAGRTGARRWERWTKNGLQVSTSAAKRTGDSGTTVSLSETPPARPLDCFADPPQSDRSLADVELSDVPTDLTDTVPETPRLTAREISGAICTILRHKSLEKAAPRLQHTRHLTVWGAAYC